MYEPTPWQLSVIDSLLAEPRLLHKLMAPTRWGKTTCVLMVAIYMWEVLHKTVLVVSHRFNRATTHHILCQDLKVGMDLSYGVTVVNAMGLIGISKDVVILDDFLKIAKESSNFIAKVELYMRNHYRCLLVCRYHTADQCLERPMNCHCRTSMVVNMRTNETKQLTPSVLEQMRALTLKEEVDTPGDSIPEWTPRSKTRVARCLFPNK